MSLFLCIFIGLLHSVPEITGQQPERGSNGGLLRVVRAEHSFMDPKGVLERVNPGALADTPMKKPVLAHEIPSETVAGCMEGGPPTYAKATCSTVPGRVICRLGKYTFVINNGDHKMEPEVIERFAAMLFHRTQEGDTNFDVLVDTPAREQAFCPEQTLVSADEQQSKQQSSSSARDLPVFVECTPVNQPGCKAHPQTEVVYSCKKHGLGIGKRAVISVDSTGKVSDGKLILPYFRLRKRSAELPRMSGDSYINEASESSGSSGQLTPEVERSKDRPTQDDKANANFITGLKVAVDEKSIDGSSGSVDEGINNQQAITVEVVGNLVGSGDPKGSDLVKPQVQGSISNYTKVFPENSHLHVAEQTAKTSDKHIIEYAAQQTETNVVQSEKQHPDLGASQLPGSTGFDQAAQNSAPNSFQPVAQSPVQNSNDPAAQDSRSNSNPPAASYSVSKSNIPAPSNPGLYVNVPGAQNSVSNSNIPTAPLTDLNQNSAGATNSVSNSYVPSVLNQSWNQNAPAAPNYLSNSNQTSASNSVGNSNISEGHNYGAGSPDSAADSIQPAGPNVAQPIPQNKNSQNKEQGASNSALYTVEQKQQIPASRSTGANPVVQPEKKESSGVLRSVITHIKSSVKVPLKMVGVESINNNPTGASGGKVQIGPLHELAPMPVCKVLQATMDSGKEAMLSLDVNKIDEGPEKNVKNLDNNINNQINFKKGERPQVKRMHNLSPPNDLGINSNNGLKKDSVLNIDVQKTGEQEKGVNDSPLVDKDKTILDKDTKKNNGISSEKNGEILPKNVQSFSSKETRAEQHVDNGKVAETQLSINNMEVTSKPLTVHEGIIDQEAKANREGKEKSQHYVVSGTAKMEHSQNTDGNVAISHNNRESFRDPGNKKDAVGKPDDSGENILQSPSLLNNKLEGAVKVINKIEGALNTLDQGRTASQEHYGVSSGSKRPETGRNIADVLSPNGPDQSKYVLSDFKSSRSENILGIPLVGNMPEPSTLQNGPNLSGRTVVLDGMAGEAAAEMEEGGEEPRGENLAGFFYQTKEPQPVVREFTDICHEDETQTGKYWCPIEGWYDTTCGSETEGCVTVCEDNIPKQWQGPGSVRRRDTSGDLGPIAVNFLSSKSLRKRQGSFSTPTTGSTTKCTTSRPTFAGADLSCVTLPPTSSTTICSTSQVTCPTPATTCGPALDPPGEVPACFKPPPPPPICPPPPTTQRSCLREARKAHLPPKRTRQSKRPLLKTRHEEKG